jgi:hypothetical protein
VEVRPPPHSPPAGTVTAAAAVFRRRYSTKQASHDRFWILINHLEFDTKYITVQTEA